MRIGYVLQDPRRQPPTGLDVYTSSLWDALCAAGSEFEFVPIMLPARIAGRAYLRAAWEQLYLPLWARRHKIDLLHLPAGSVPVLRTVPAVLTLHDLGDGATPAYRTPLGPRLYFSRLVPDSARFASALICDSEATKRDAAARLGIALERMTVVPLAAPAWCRRATKRAVAAARRKHGLGERYFLFVGARIPRKNLAGALAGFARFRAHVADVQFAVVGGSGFGERSLPPEARALPEDSVRFLGHVPDDELAALYTGALAVVLPSFYEGFGLPLAEAFACGTPAIASDVASLPEVGGDAALYVDPRDADSIAQAMERIATQPALRKALASRAKARSQQLSWRRAAEQTLDVYRSVLGERRVRVACGRPPKVLFVRLDSLGDLVLTTPCFEAVKRAYPDATVYVVTRPETAALLRGDPRVDHVYTLDAPWHGRWRWAALPDVWRMLRRLRREWYDCVITLRRDLDDAIFAGACGGRETLGFSAARTRPFLTSWVRVAEGKHTVENHLALTGLLGCEREGLRPSVACTSGDAGAIDALLGASDGVVGVAPFASSEAKSLAPAAVARLVDALAQRVDAPIVLLGGPGDRARGGAAVRRTNEPVIDLTGKTELPELCDVLRRCRLLVCVDSGPMHLAAALGVPVVALFGEEALALWRPYTGAPYRVLRALDARGRCSAGAVPLGTVLAAVDDLLSDRVEEAA